MGPRNCLREPPPSQHFWFILVGLGFEASEGALVIRSYLLRNVLTGILIFLSLGYIRAQVPENAYQELQWRMIGPFRGGRTRAAAGVPGQPNVYYVGAVNGGVWKSDDYGRSWTPIFDSQPTQSIGAIAVAPSDPNIVYVGSGEGLHRPDLSVGDGIYRSTDAGKTWIHLGLRDGQQIPALAVDPRDPNRVFAAVLGHPYGPSEERGIYGSTDGGQTWQKVISKDENTGGSDVQIDSANPDVVYASMWEAREGPWEDNNEVNGSHGGLFKSTDGGSTWHALTKGLPRDLAQIYVAIAPSEPRRLYATLGTSSGKLGVYRSDDAGENWSQITDDPRPAGRIGGGDLPVPKVDPKNPDMVYVASTVTMRSTDGGKTWSGFRGAPGGDDYQNLWINPNDGRIILLVGDQGALVTVNGGATWSSWYNQPTAQIYHVSVSNTFPYRVCGGQQESGSVCIASRGNDGEITFRDWHPVGAIEYGYVAPDPLDSDVVYGGGRSEVSKFHWSTGQVQNITPIPLRSPKFRANRTEPLMFSPVDPHILYYATNVLFKTSDGGHSWQTISSDLTRENPGVPASVGALVPNGADKQRGVIYSLAPSFKNVNTLWAGTDDGLVWFTADGGKSWKDITPPQLTPWSKVTQISASHFDERSAYVSVSRFRINDVHPYIYRTHDGGKSWKLITTGLPDFGPIDTVREDPVRKGLLFAGTENSVWVSFDDGDHWQSLQLNLPHTAMRDLWIHENDLIVATHGRSFWVLDDIAPLREVAESMARSEARLFAPAAAFRVRRDTNTDTPLPPDEPAAANPPDGAVIDYYLAGAASGPVTVEILDEKGQLIRRYSSVDLPEVSEADLKKQLIPLYWIRMHKALSTAAGMHRWIWDLQYTPPTSTRHDYPIAAIAHDTPRFPPGPTVLPGRYTVRLTVNGKSYTAPLTVKMDPRVRTSAAGLEKKFQVETRLASIVTLTAEAGLQGGSIQDQLQKLAERSDAASKNTIEKFEKKLADMLGAAAESSAPPSDQATLSRINAQARTLYAQIWPVDAEPTSSQMEAVSATERGRDEAMKRWNEFKVTDLPALNQQLREAKLPEVSLQTDLQQEESQTDEE
ncbi:MAG: glycoside hydrolase [Acidobacteriia bacterium]|nr:glycoside hydrolase [Terriglobia bacterium]